MISTHSCLWPKASGAVFKDRAEPCKNTASKGLATKGHWFLSLVTGLWYRENEKKEVFMEERARKHRKDIKKAFEADISVKKDQKSSPVYLTVGNDINEACED